MSELARAERPAAEPGVVVPALYAVTVRHTRRERITRTFRHRTYLWLVDLDAPPELPRWLRPFAGFDPGPPGRAGLDRWLAERGVDLAGGRVLVLAHARVLGHAFNPLTVYWCHRADGAPACVVAEVHNTYGQQHRYLLHPDAGGRARTAKALYVSPFFPVDGEYRMALPEPGERLALAVTLHRGGAPALTATVTGLRVRATPGALVRLLLRHPFAPQRTSALIRRHGIALWLRRLPVVPRPRVHPTPQEGRR